MFWPLRFLLNPGSDVDTQKQPGYTKLKRILKHIYIRSSKQYTRKKKKKKRKRVRCLKIFPLVAKLNSTGIHCATLNQLELLQKSVCQHEEWQNRNSGSRSLSGNHTKARGMLHTVLRLANQIRQTYLLSDSTSQFSWSMIISQSTLSLISG